jgi:hypothetical protein
MSDSEHDDEFEAYLKRRLPINKPASSLEHLEPPPELDRIVISKARNAIKGVSPIRFLRAPQWALPVGLAATILLSFAIMLDLGVRELRNETAVQATTTSKATVVSQPVTPGPNSPAPTAVPPVATAPWPPAQVPPASSTAALRADAAEKAGNDKVRARLARAEVAAKRLRTDTDAELASRDPSSKVRLASLPNVQQEDVSISMDLSPALASMASSARAAIEGIPDPAARLEQIEKLRSNGHPTQAEREMKQFRATYPDYPMSAADQ